MNFGGITASVTALANALASKLSLEETAFLAAIFVQLGDTLATITAHRAICEEKNVDNNKN